MVIIFVIGIHPVFAQQVLQSSKVLFNYSEHLLSSIWATINTITWEYSQFHTCKMVYFSDIKLWNPWCGDSCIQVLKYTSHTLHACCNQSEFSILKIHKSSVCPLFLYNCTPNTFRTHKRSIGCIHTRVWLILLLIW